MATAAETKAAQERHEAHDKEQAKLPGSISSDSTTTSSKSEGVPAGSVGEPIGNLSDKRQKAVAKQREETTKVYAEEAERAEKLREESAKEAAKQAATLAKEQVDEQGAWAWPAEPLPGELPPYSTAKDAKAAEAQQRKADRRSTRDDDDTSTVEGSKS